MSYALNRAWSDRFIPTIKNIVGPYLLQPSSLEVDTKQAADLVVLKARDMTIACRVRKPGFFANFQYEFTVRARAENGGRTELDKFLDGWGDWMFYGHASAVDSIEIAAWWLLDLHAWRAALLRDRKKCEIDARFIENNDGCTGFIVFDVRHFKLREGCDRLVIASQPKFFPLPQLVQRSLFTDAA